MSVWQVFGFAIVGAMLAMLVRRVEPSLGLMVSLGAGLVLLIWAVPQVEAVKAALKKITRISGLDAGYLSVMLKALFIACVAELAAQTCQDMGEGGLALKAALLGKLLILVLSAPLLYGVVELIVGLLP